MLQFILQHVSLQSLIWFIPGLPLAGAAINGTIAVIGARLGWRRGAPLVSIIGVLLPFLAFACALINFWILTGIEQTEPMAVTGPLFKWLVFDNWTVEVGLNLDQLSLVMALVVTGVGSLIHLYSVGYMHGDDGYARYFAELNLFLFFMLLLVLADNLLIMFIGWEGVGLCSYLLISFWFDDPYKAYAGKKAFVVNRIGDFGFMLGIFLIITHLTGVPDPLNFGSIERNVVALVPMATPICLLFFLGAVGKSAQIPLYVWLPDAMAGPTPVSALIHAATMVTAGVYMVARLNFLFILSPLAMDVVAWVGALTALYAATLGLVQSDLKKVLAYSTISQLGFMFLAEGVGAFGAGIFHLVTHAFFKALLFLAAGSVIHAMGGEQRLENFGGLKRWLPGTYWTFFIATLAICGVWPFAGFFSKDGILWAVFSQGRTALWLVGFTTAGFTAFYMFRALTLTFLGAPRFDPSQKHHLTEASLSMLVPLVILAVLSIIGGFVSAPLAGFLAPRFAVHPVEGPRITEIVMAIISVAWAVHWGAVSWIIYIGRRDWVTGLTQRFKRSYKVMLNNYYVDELYGLIFVRPVEWISRVVLWQGVDTQLIDNVAVNGPPRSVGLLGRVVTVAQTGLVPHYIFFMVIGVCIIAVAVAL